MFYRLLALGDKYPKQADLLLLILGFSLGANFFVFLRFEELEQIGLLLNRGQFELYWLNPSLSGIMIGFGLIFLESRLTPRLNLGYGLNITVRFILFSVMIIGCIGMVHIGSTLVYGTGWRSALNSYGYFVDTHLFFTLYVYLLFLAVSINFFRVIGNFFGHGIIVNYIIGKYREPTEENRVFMMLDLNHSTRIAEHLGHLRYSRFLNKCFTDLSAVLSAFDGEIYQYVGDEAIITWNLKGLKDPAKPLLLFRAFAERLHDNADEYLEKFDTVPSFKAAINAGPVSVSLVGGRKKEMAFHGDVLNTASRVLEQCRKLSQGLLITQTFAEVLELDPRVSVIHLQDLVLRGKNDSISIYQPVFHSHPPPLER